MHHLLHYAKQTGRYGPLRQYSMYAFERFNGRFKGVFVRNRNHAMTSAAHSFTVDAAAKYYDWKREDDDDCSDMPTNTVCRLSGRTKFLLPTAAQITDIIIAGAADNLSTVEVRLGAFEARSHAHVCGVRFTAGESLTGTVAHIHHAISLCALATHFVPLPPSLPSLHLCQDAQLRMYVCRSGHYVAMASSSVRLFVYRCHRWTFQIRTVW